jgi:hypothetical protein
MVRKLPTLIGQRVFGIALGYEDLIDHDDLRRDPGARRRARSARGEASRPGAFEYTPLVRPSTSQKEDSLPTLRMDRLSHFRRRSSPSPAVPQKGL